jgi:hypothetical protein
MAFKNRKTGRISNPARGEQTSQTARPPMASNPLTSEEVKDSPAPSRVGAHATASKGDKKTPRKRAKTERPKADHRMTVTQLDAFALEIAGLPMAVKDKETFAQMFMRVEKVSDTERFMNLVHETEVPTPKT